MDTKELFEIAQFTVPMYTALICGLLLLRMYFKNESPLGRKNIKWILYAYGLSCFNWFSIILYVAIPSIYVLLNPLFLLSFMAISVMYYRFIFELTRINPNEKFGAIHYLLPVSAFMLMLIWSFLTPFDVQLNFIGFSPLDESSNILSFLRPLLYSAYATIYALFGIYRTIRFRKVVTNYSADEQRISLAWLYQFLFIMVATLPMTVTMLFSLPYFFISSGIALLPILIAILKDVLLAHNILLENYVIIKPDSLHLQEQQLKEILLAPIPPNDIRKFEAYMHKNKPYLNSQLKISDMTTDLNTNRTSLSVLINKTYGMNFNRYINVHRLKEVEKIKTDPKYAHLSEIEWSTIAGFSDYRGYKRVKQREENNNNSNDNNLEKNNH